MVKLFIAKTLYHVSGKNASFSEKLIPFLFQLKQIFPNELAPSERSVFLWSNKIL